MTFGEAMALVADGKTVRRDAWPGDRQAGLRLNQYGFVAWSGDGWMAGIREGFILADDWVMVTPRDAERPAGTDDPRRVREMSR